MLTHFSSGRKISTTRSSSRLSLSHQLPTEEEEEEEKHTRKMYAPEMENNKTGRGRHVIGKETKGSKNDCNLQERGCCLFTSGPGE